MPQRDSEHIAVIPARAGSKGLPGKNRLLFPLLAEFLESENLFDRVIVTSDDELLLDMAASRGWETRLRPEALALDSSCITDAFKDVAAHCPVGKTDYLWLVFIPLVFRNAADFREARKIVGQEEPGSLCSFIPAHTHPFVCWRVDESTGKIAKFIENDLFNRQDFPPAWENYNYLSCVRVNELEHLNSNLLNKDTRPIFLSAEKAEQFVELDEPRDLHKWRDRHPEEYNRWRLTLSAQEIADHEIP